MNVPQDWLDALNSDPNVARIKEALAPAIPILARMALDQAVAAMASLLSKDPDAGMLALRRNATEDEWSVLVDQLTNNATLAALQKVELIEWTQKAAFNLLLSLLTLLL